MQPSIVLISYYAYIQTSCIVTHALHDVLYLVRCVSDYNLESLQCILTPCHQRRYCAFHVAIVFSC